MSRYAFTAKLPLSIEDITALIGTFEGSIHSGVINGLVHEIDGFIDEYKALGSKFIIILTAVTQNFWLND
jgi:type III pantothenate kinase